MIDVSDTQRQTVLDILSRFIPSCEVRAFGSRCTRKAKPYSDLDLVIVGKEKVPSALMYDIVEALQESDLPWRVDVLDWHGISQEFRTVIEQSGYEIVQKGIN